MPNYRTWTAPVANATKKKKTRKYAKRLPRDPKKMYRWAARGTEKDYAKLRDLAAKARHSLPAHIDGEAFERIAHVDRLRLIEEIQAAEQHDISAGFFLDGLNWLLDKVPWGNWLWPVSAAQSSINAQKGDGLNDVDEQYARLVGATYGSVQERPYVIDHWKRQVQFDSDYVSVWDNPDGHRLIAIRGTQGTATDIGQYVLIGLTGQTTDLLGGELLQILAATPTGTVVDLAAHSLGTTLALQAFGNSTVYNGIHETYLYNPAYSPLLQGSADAYERDPNVRYFINTNDLVSMGSFGHQAPSNVVFRSKSGITDAHALAQWQGSGAYQDPIYHSPPETRVHAHKAVFELNKDANADDERNVHLGESEHPAATPTGHGEPAVEFDFGDVEPYDFGKL